MVEAGEPMNWSVFFIVLGGLLWFVVLSIFVCLAASASMDNRWKRMSLYIAAAIFWVAFTAAFVPWSSDSATSHEWTGGTGPATVCNFEKRTRMILVGKVTVPQDYTVTVCRDGASR